MFGWILLGLGAVLVAVYLLAGAAVGLYESSQTDDPFKKMTLIDWLPRLFGFGFGPKL